MPQGEPAFVGYRPGVIADIVGLHARHYARDWGFGLAFEAKVAQELAAFACAMDAKADLFLNAIGPAPDGAARTATEAVGGEGVDAVADGPLLGSITIDRTVTGADGAHLRWFIVDDAARGLGLGRTLMARAMAFCEARDYRHVWLTTFDGLAPARHLYEAFGFRLTAEAAIDQWHGGVREQRFERRT